jgi:hypothetical protein
MDAHPLCLPGRLPFTPALLEITHQFFLFRIHRDDRLALLLMALNLLVNMFKLCIAIGMLSPFGGLAVGLQTIVQIV